MLLIFTYRPEFVPGWGGRSYHSQITLNRLSNPESLEIMGHLLGTQEIAADLEELTLKKTEGVAFFIEEFVKSLNDLKMIVRKGSRVQLTRWIQAVAIPSTIQDMIMARVDSLPEAVKSVLQTGSVIEREFTYELIKRVTGLEEQQLLSNLSRLKDSELIFERGVYPESTYIFKHALTRDVVYESILVKTRREIHERIGKAIQGLYRDKIEDHYEALVNHFTAGGNYRKAADYSRLACRKTHNSMSLPEAIDYGKRWIAALEELSRPEEWRDEIIEARTTLGFNLLRMSRMAEAKEAIEPIMTPVLEMGRKDRAGQIYLILGSCKYMTEEDLAESIRYLEKAIEVSRETRNYEINVYAKYMLALVLAFNCDFEKAILHFEPLLRLRFAVERTWRVSIIKRTSASMPLITTAWWPEAFRQARTRSGWLKRAGILSQGHGLREPRDFLLLPGASGRGGTIPDPGSRSHRKDQHVCNQRGGPPMVGARLFRPG